MPFLPPQSVSLFGAWAQLRCCLPAHPPCLLAGHNSLHRDGELPGGALALPDQEGSQVVPLHQNLFCQLPGNPARVPSAERGDGEGSGGGAGSCFLCTQCSTSLILTAVSKCRDLLAPILQMRNLRHREMEQRAQGYMLWQAGAGDQSQPSGSWAQSLPTGPGKHIPSGKQNYQTSVTSNPVNPSRAFPF